MQIDYSKRIFGLDALRALAILGVLAYHTLSIFPELNGWLTSVFNLTGLFGVELFFILSGYLIGGILYNIFTNDSFHKNELRYFVIRRWFRTLPNYFLVLILNLMVLLVVGESLPKDVWKYFLFFQNLADPIGTFFQESWTLPIEEAAYIIGPLLLLLTTFKLFRKKPKGTFLIVTLMVIAIFTLTKVYYSLNTTNTTLLQWNFNLKAVVIYRVDAIYYGFLLAYFAKNASKKWSAYALSLGLLGGLGLPLFLYTIYSRQFFIETYPIFWIVFFLPICSIFLALLFPLFSKLKTAPKYILKPITFISITSYSVYLLHYSFVLKGMNHFFPFKTFSLGEKMGYVGIYYMVLFALAYMVYRFYEKPIMNLRDRSFFRKLGDP